MTPNTQKRSDRNIRATWDSVCIVAQYYAKVFKRLQIESLPKTFMIHLFFYLKSTGHISVYIYIYDIYHILYHLYHISLYMMSITPYSLLSAGFE